MVARSKVDRLPEDLRVKLHQLIDSKQHTCIEIADLINVELEQYRDETDVESISKNVVNREAQRIKDVGEKMRQTQQMVKAISEKYQLDTLNDTGKALQGVLGSALMHTSTTLMSEGDLIDPESLNELTLAMNRLQRGAKFSADMEKEIEERARLKALAEAADVVESAAQQRGLSAENAMYLRQEVLGVKGG